MFQKDKYGYFLFGAGSVQIFFRVILPEILPALIAGFTMSFARGLGEYDYASATSIALVMLMIAFVILFINAILQSRTSKIVSGRKIR